KNSTEVFAWEKQGLLFVRRWMREDESFIVYNFNASREACEIPFLAGGWSKVIDSAEECWQGKGSALPRTLDASRMPMLEMAPRAFALFRHEPKSGRSER